MIEIGQKKAIDAGVDKKITFKTGRLNAIPLEDHIADLVYGSFVIHELPDPTGAVKEALRIVQRGSYIEFIDIGTVKSIEQAQSIKNQFGFINWLYVKSISHGFETALEEILPYLDDLVSQHKIEYSCFQVEFLKVLRIHLLDKM